METASAARSETRVSGSLPADTEASKAAAQMSARICLMCLSKFQSLGRHNRNCPTCKNSAEYESANRLPDLDFPVGDV
jgi:hypothetical protein